MQSTQSFTSNSLGHEPKKPGFTMIGPRLYKDAEGKYYFQGESRTVEKHHRTGKKAYVVDYVALPDEFQKLQLTIILSDMAKRKS